MGIRKGAAYTKKYARPYTRKSKKSSKSYIKAVPNPKIVKYQMGDVAGYNDGKYPVKIVVYSKDRLQIRDNAIEAVRQHLNRFLQTDIGKEFYLEVKIHPHHILRENKMITGAGADRMQTGMARSFGRTVGRAAFVVPNQEILIIGLKDVKFEAQARKLIKSSKARLPCKVVAKTFVTKPAVA